MPTVLEAATQTRNTGKNVSVQFRSSRTAKGKYDFSTQCCVIEKRNFHHDNFPCISVPLGGKTTLCKNIFAGCQTSIAQKSQETQCTLLKDFFTTSTPVQSDEELSENEDEMEQDDDPSYVPDPEEIDPDANDNETGFDDFDDCLYE